MSQELQVTPEGHVLLLLEESPGKRTFSDYQDIHQCLHTMVNMYEEYRDIVNDTDSGDLKDFLAWLDKMHRIDCFQYSREINRYKNIPRVDLKRMFGEKECGSEKPSPPLAITNGSKTIPEAEPDPLEEYQLDYDDDDDEGWDK